MKVQLRPTRQELQLFVGVSSEIIYLFYNAFETADCLITVSQAVRDFYAGHLKVPKDKIEVVYNAFETALTQMPKQLNHQSHSFLYAQPWTRHSIN